MSDARGKAQQDARDEYRRLLYVAMTRAKERLVIAGTQGRNKIPDGCWYRLVEDALKGDCVAGAGRRRRWRRAALPQKRVQEHRSADEQEEHFACRDQAEFCAELAEIERNL